MEHSDSDTLSRTPYNPYRAEYTLHVNIQTLGGVQILWRAILAYQTTKRIIFQDAMLETIATVVVIRLFNGAKEGTPNT